MAQEFKVGDKVKVKKEVKIKGSRPNGYEGIITSIKPNYDGEIYFLDNGNGVWLVDLEINNNQNKIMNSLKEKFAMLMKGEPDKSFFKAGITNADYSLTTEGQGIFMEWLLKKNGEAFKTEVVDPLIKAQEESCK